MLLMRSIEAGTMEELSIFEATISKEFSAVCAGMMGIRAFKNRMARGVGLGLVSPWSALVQQHGINYGILIINVAIIINRAQPCSLLGLALHNPCQPVQNTSGLHFAPCAQKLACTSRSVEFI